jgi:hypothetical protein
MYYVTLKFDCLGLTLAVPAENGPFSNACLRPAGHLSGIAITSYLIEVMPIINGNFTWYR